MKLTALRPLSASLALLVSPYAIKDSAIAADNGLSASVSVTSKLHLVDTTGRPVTLVPGVYTVEAGSGLGLRVTGPDGRATLLRAMTRPVGDRPDRAVAMVVASDQRSHLLLTLPGGLQFDAAEVDSGVRSRGLPSLSAARPLTATQGVPALVAGPSVATSATGTSSGASLGGAARIAPGATPGVSVGFATTYYFDPCAGALEARPAMSAYTGPAAPGSSGTTPKITAVIPSSFVEGQLVTICGAGLSEIQLLDSYPPGFPGTVPTNPLPDLATLVQAPGNFVRIRATANQPDLDVRVRAISPMISSSGDRITFYAGYAFQMESACAYAVNPKCNTISSLALFLDPLPPPPTAWAGPLILLRSGSGSFSQLAVQGPPVTWGIGPPVIGKLYGQEFYMQEPFAIVPGFVGMSGFNLLGPESSSSITLNGVAVNNSQSYLHDDGTDFEFYIYEPPAGPVSVAVCDIRHSLTACAPGPITVLPRPTVTAIPPMPLHPRTRYTITGANLVPPAGLSLTYQLFLSGAMPTDRDPYCGNRLQLQVQQMTAQSIVFSLGSPSDTSPLPAGCNPSLLFPAQPPTPMYLFMFYQNQNHSFWSGTFYVQ